MKTALQNSSLDVVGIGALSYGISLAETNLKVSIVLMVAGLLAVLIKYLSR